VPKQAFDAVIRRSADFCTREEQAFRIPRVSRNFCRLSFPSLCEFNSLQPICPLITPLIFVLFGKEVAPELCESVRFPTGKEALHDVLLAPRV